jgi:1-acyl-sn-glycerol-3-phosphate acyltransferase
MTDHRFEAASARVQAIARDLANELQASKSSHPEIHATSDLERDLGLDSLGRAELLHRLEREFRIRLSEQLLADAVTVQDLVRGVLAAQPAEILPAPMAPFAPHELAKVAEPSRVCTLLEAFEEHVRAHGSRPHLHLWLSDTEEKVISYAELDARARCAAAGLVASAIEPGSRVAIMLPTEADFFTAFLSVLMAGCIPVPVYPPFRPAQVEEHLQRQAGILRNARACMLITDAKIRPLSALLRGLVGDLQSITTVDELSLEGWSTSPLPAGDDTVALIQYTSGSTGDPKGVVLTHANLLANIRAMGEVMQASSGDRFVSWLPLYHDMGLIGAWLGSLYYGAPAAIMPPLAFMARPSRWLKSIHRHKATLSAAPNFAFELCLKSIRDDEIEGLDLSSLRMVANGAEPVSPHTIAQFTERFARVGFRREAMAPVYGLAECSVGLAFPPVGRAPIVDRVDRVRLAHDGEAVPAARDDTTALEFVACGQALPRHQIRIVDESGSEIPDRRQGRLEFKGPSATKGYFANEEKTRTLFDGEWLDSGDLAYMVDGDVYLTGRIKDMIIRAGRNIYPHELEEAVGAVEGVRRGCVAVFASRDERTATERLIVMAETRLTEAGERNALRDRILGAAVAILEMPPDEVVLVPPRTVPKTSSGKIRRSAARILFESGELSAERRAVWLQLTRLGIEGVVGFARRTSRRVLELAYAAYWWLLLIGFGVVVWPLVMLLPRRGQRHFLVGAAGRWFFRMTGVALTIEGAGVPPDSGVIIVANHSSYLDGLVLSATIPGELTFVAKYGFKSRPIVGPFLERLGTVFVHRLDAKAGVEDTKAVLEAAERGARIVILPEGTFARMPGLLPFRLGGFLVAAQSHRPVLPVALKGTRMILRDVQWFPRRGAIAVHVGAPVHADGTEFDAAVRLRDKVRAEILQKVGEPDLARERVPLPED